MRITRALQIGLIAWWAALAVLTVPSARAGVPAPTYFLGDVNCDGQVDSIDAALLLQVEAALLDEPACEHNADMDGNASANSIDAGLVLQYTAGLIYSRVQFSLNVTRPAGLCDDAEKPSVCNVPAGTEFGLSIALNHPPPEGYITFQTQLVYGDLTYNAATYAVDEVVWPESGLAVRAVNSFAYLEHVLAHGALSSAAPPFRVSRHRGDLVRLSMSCPSQPRSFTLQLLTYDPLFAPHGSVVSLPIEDATGNVEAVTVSAGTKSIGLDFDGDGTPEQEQDMGIAARLRINCVE